MKDPDRLALYKTRSKRKIILLLNGYTVNLNVMLEGLDYWSSVTFVRASFLMY